MTALPLRTSRPVSAHTKKAHTDKFYETHDAMSRYLATDAGKIEAGMYALGLVCERAVRNDPEYREAF